MTDVIAKLSEVTIIKDGHEYQGEHGIVIDVAKGWYTVEMNDTEEEVIIKMRQADLEIWVEEEAEEKSMSGTLNKYRKNYQTTHTAKGNKSQSSKLSVTARHMEGYDHGQVAQMAASLLDAAELTSLYHQYAHLNNGQMRMNCGNKINNAVKRGDLIEEDVAAIVEQHRDGSFEMENTETLDRKHRPERCAQILG